MTSSTPTIVNKFQQYAIMPSLRPLPEGFIDEFFSLLEDDLDDAIHCHLLESLLDLIEITPPKQFHRTYSPVRRQIKSFKKAQVQMTEVGLRASCDEKESFLSIRPFHEQKHPSLAAKQLQTWILDNITVVSIKHNESRRCQLYTRLITNNTPQNDGNSSLDHPRLRNLISLDIPVGDESRGLSLSSLIKLKNLTIKSSLFIDDDNLTPSQLFEKNTIFENLEVLDLTDWYSDSFHGYKYLSDESGCMFPNLKTLKLPLEYQLDVKTLKYFSTWIERTMPLIKNVWFDICITNHNQLKSLVASSLLSKVTHFYLQSSVSIHKLLTSVDFMNNNNLVQIQFCWVKFDQSLMELFSKNGNFSQLKEITFIHCQLTDEIMSLLCNSTVFTRLSKLELISNSGLRDKTFSYINPNQDNQTAISIHHTKMVNYTSTIQFNRPENGE